MVEFAFGYCQRLIGSVGAHVTEAILRHTGVRCDEQTLR